MKEGRILTPAISLIVPISDKDEYTDGFLQDIRNQTYDNYEVIMAVSEKTTNLISETDETLEKDERIRKLVCKKGDIASLRNCGIKAALGTYIVFCETTDVLSPDYFITLLKAVSKGKNRSVKGFDRMAVELAYCGYELYDREGIFFETPETGIRVLDAEDMLCRIFYMGNYEGGIFNKIFRRDIIERYHLRFDKGRGRRKEQLFLTKYLKHISSVRMDPKRVISHLNVLDQNGSVKKERHRHFENALSLIKMSLSLITHADAGWLCRQNLRYELDEWRR